jgi:inhibitor of KinA sporulation pathway (predicted exonuclease)
MNLMALDLENNQPSGKIIQVGYCIGNTDTGEITKYPGIWVDCGEEVTEYIIKLCHVNTTEYNADKTTLKHAYDTMAKDYVQKECRLNAVTWGGGDTECLRTQLGFQDTKWVFGRRWADTKTLAQTYFVANNISFPGGLAKSMTKLGLKFDGTKHRADDDAYNTMKVYLHLFNKLKENK